MGLGDAAARTGIGVPHGSCVVQMVTVISSPVRALRTDPSASTTRPVDGSVKAATTLRRGAAVGATVGAGVEPGSGVRVACGVAAGRGVLVGVAAGGRVGTGVYGRGVGSCPSAAPDTKAKRRRSRTAGISARSGRRRS